MFSDDRSGTFPVDIPFQPSSHGGKQLLGDYYRFDEVGDTKRGFSISPNELPSDCDFQNPFYNEDDKMMRGLCLAPGMVPDNFSSGAFYDEVSKPFVTPRFEHFQTPPDAPADPLFKLQPTTFICRCSAAECMNLLLDFFEFEVTSAVTKVCRAKFAIKVDAFDKGLLCRLKLRMYRQQTSELVVEFQRRSGDTVAFHEVYQQARLKLEPRSPCTETFADVTPPIDQLEGPASVVELSPLVDMLAQSHTPELQAEAAAGLANIASGNPTLAIVMCSVHLFEHLPKLLQIDRIDVAYPVACLLSLLADCSAAQTLIVDYGMVPAMEKQIQSVQKSALVKKQLGAAIDASCQLGHWK